jgi:hypothetical protein
MLKRDGKSAKFRALIGLRFLCSQGFRDRHHFRSVTDYGDSKSRPCTSSAVVEARAVTENHRYLAHRGFPRILGFIGG